jgi:hypothetical protein
MVEATHRLQQAPATDQAQRASMSRAVMVLARQRAVREAKRRLQAQELKPAHYLHREVVAMAEAYITQHPELIAEARETALRWLAEGLFGKKAARSVQCAALAIFAHREKA